MHSPSPEHVATASRITASYTASFQSHSLLVNLIVAALADERTQAIADTLERCIRATCRQCAEGLPLVPVSDCAAMRHEAGPCHPYGNGTHAGCDAAHLRALTPREGGERDE